MDNSNEEIKKYIQAIESAIAKAHLRADDSVEISDIWVITSLPIDLIMECLKSPHLILPSNVSKITSDKKTILKNSAYTGRPNNLLKEE